MNYREPGSDPAHQRAAGSAHDGGHTPVENNHALADLVWKYFSEEITQAVNEVQEALAPEQGGLKKQVSRSKKVGK
jgi:hypothetical protein